MSNIPNYSNLSKISQIQCYILRFIIASPIIPKPINKIDVEDVFNLLRIIHCRTTLFAYLVNCVFSFSFGEILRVQFLRLNIVVR